MGIRRDEFLLELNPDLVIVHVSGYGEMGEPDYVRRPSYDPIAQAFSGFMYINSPRGTKPMAVFPGIGDFITALFALWSSLAALLRARETGEGDVIDLSQYEAILRVSAQYPAEYFTKGNQLVRNPDIDGDVGGLGVYECRDGRYVYVALNPSALKSDGLALLGLTGDPDFDRQDAIVAGTARDEKSRKEQSRTTVCPIRQARSIVTSTRSISAAARSWTTRNWETIRTA